MADLNQENQEVEKEEVSPTAVTVELDPPAPPQGPVVYVEEAPIIPDNNRRYVDALNRAARASALGNDPLPYFTSVQVDPLYDASDRSQSILDSVGAIAEQVTPKMEEAAAKGEDTSWLSSKFKSAMDFVFPSGNPAQELAESSVPTEGLDVPSVSKAAMMDARAYVASIPTTSGMTDAEKEDAAFVKYMEFMTAKVADEIGFNWGTVGDIAGFLVPQENLRYEEVAEVLGVEYNAMDYVDYRDFLARTSAYIRQEAPEKQQAMVESLISAWPEIHGNNRIALVDTLQLLAGSEDPYSMLRTADNALERVDQATLGALTIGKAISGSLKALGAIRTATKLGNVEAVTDLITAGSKGVLEPAGVSPMDAVSSLNPMESTNTLVKGADNTFATEAGNIQNDVDIYLEAAEKVNNYGLGLSLAEQVAYRTRVVEDLEGLGSLKNIKAEALDDNGFKITYELESSGVRVTENRVYGLDAVGGFVSKGGEGHIDLDFYATSPAFRFVSDRKPLVSSFEQIMSQGAKIQHNYDQAVMSALSPGGKKLSKKERQGVEAALIKGDEYVDELGRNVGREFTRDELVEEGIDGIKLTDRQYDAYQNVRKVVDHFHYLKNKEIVDQYKVRGYNLTDWEGLTVPVKAYADPQDALKGFRSSKTRSHWIGDIDGKVHTFKGPSELSPDFLEKKYAQGYRLTRAVENRLFEGGATKYEWAFTKAENLRQPGGMILNKRNGYIPRINKDAFYFVKESHDVNIAGKVYTGGIQKTVRYFDNYREANDYANKLNKDSPGKYRVLADRELSATDLEGEFLNISGGLFTGARSEGVPFGTHGVKARRENVLRSLQRYVRNISRNVPVNLYRAGIQQRWINHAKNVGALSKNYTGSFEEAVHGRHLNLQNDTAPFLRDAHAQISLMTGIRTESERIMLAKQREIMKKIPMGGWLSRRIHNLSSEGIYGAIRGANFHLMLGMYNPAQFLIQASGAFVAMTIHPVHGVKAVGQMAAYATLDNILGNPAQKAKALEAMKAKGFDIEGYELWDQSGIREGIVKTNLDYNTIFTDLPYDAGVMRKVMDNSTFFHKQGELVAARVAFATAYNYWKEGAKGRKAGVSDLKDILARTETLRLNMSAANKAGFQQGVLSIPTQFQQVNTKFFEKLLGRGELTRREKASLIVGQAVLFGTAGIPLAKSIYPHFVNTLNQFLPEDEQWNAVNTSPEVLNAVRNGMLAWMIQDYMDIESVITGRMALGQDFIENIFGLFNSTVDLMDIAKGPTATLWDGATTGIERTQTAFSFVTTAEDVNIEDLAAVGSILGQSLLELPASTRNLIKSYDMTHSQFFRNKQGRPIAEWSDLNTQTIVAQALGFSAQEVADYHELNNRNMGAVPKSVTDSDVNRIVRYLVDMNTTDDETNARRYGYAVNAIMTKYPQFEDRVKVFKQVEQKIKDPSDPWGKLMLGVVNDWQSDLQNGLGEIHAKLTTKIHPEVARRFEKAGMNKANKEGDE